MHLHHTRARMASALWRGRPERAAGSVAALWICIKQQIHISYYSSKMYNRFLQCQCASMYKKCMSTSHDVGEWRLVSRIDLQQSRDFVSMFHLAGSNSKKMGCHWENEILVELVYAFDHWNQTEGIADFTHTLEYMFSQGTCSGLRECVTRWGKTRRKCSIVNIIMWFIYFWLFYSLDTNTIAGDVFQLHFKVSVGPNNTKLVQS